MIFVLLNPGASPFADWGKITFKNKKMGKVVDKLEKDQFGIELSKGVNPSKSQLKIESLGHGSYKFTITCNLTADKEFIANGDNSIKAGDGSLAVLSNNNQPQQITNVDFKFDWKDESLFFTMNAKNPPGDKGDHSN